MFFITFPPPFYDSTTPLSTKNKERNYRNWHNFSLRRHICVYLLCELRKFLSLFKIPYNGFSQSSISNLLKNIKTASRNDKNSRFSAFGEQKIFFWWANNIDFDCKRYWFREQMIMISWGKSRKSTAKDMVLGLLTLKKNYKNLIISLFSTI